MAQFKTRDDWRKERELEEARKAGTAAPLKDEEGNDINPHIPQYISQAPWYLKRENPSLKHQRPFQSKFEGAKVGEWYARGVKVQTATKFRKGACTNCGAMTHKAKDCCERPRAKGAKFTGDEIAADEVVQDIALDYDGKRDRWNGWDASMHDSIQERFEKQDEVRRKKKAEAVSKKFMTEPDPSQKRFPHQKEGGSLVDGDDEDSDREGEGEEYADASLVIQGRDPKSRMTVRNLRIREDTAKYLRNLSLDSAHYDPKTRSMRENPNPNADASEATYLGDNFVRQSGDSLHFGSAQHFAWEAYEKGHDVHLQAAPSQAALMFEQFKKKKDELKTLQKDTVLKLYGGAEHLDTIPKELIYAQTENYVEYSRDGRVVKGQEAKTTAHSKYEEDVYKNNHTSVWGSYWEAGVWGYACCRQMVRNSYCTGEAGRLAKENIIKEMNADLAARSAGGDDGEEGEEGKEERVLLPRGEKTKEEKQKEEKQKKKRLREALEDEERRSSRLEEQDERRRGYNAATRETYEVSDEQMEAYRQKKLRFDDPMRNFLASDKQD